MSPSWRNIFGEDGQMLTVLSLLGPDEHRRWSDATGEMTVAEAARRISELAGEDGRADVVLSIRRQVDPDGEVFRRYENVALADVGERLLAEAGDPGATVVLDRLSAADEERFEVSVGSEPDEHAPGPLHDAVHRFVEALRHLFNIAGEDGEPLTVLSLLVRQPDGSGAGTGGPDDEGPDAKSPGVQGPRA